MNGSREQVMLEFVQSVKVLDGKLQEQSRRIAKLIRKENKRISDKRYYEKIKNDPEFKRKRQQYKSEYDEKNKEELLAKGKIYRETNVEKRKESCKRWNQNNKDNVRLNQHKFYAKHPNYSQKYYEKNKERICEQLNKRFSNDPILRMMSNISSILCGLVKDKNGQSKRELLDFTSDELRIHLESLFTEGMSWENYGRVGWHIDHIVPVSYFEITSKHDREFKLIWSLENLKPMWGAENIRKGNKLTEEGEKLLLGWGFIPDHSRCR